MYREFTFLLQANRSMTGIECDPECGPLLKSIQRRKLRWAMFGFNDKRDLIIPVGNAEPTCKEADLTMDIIRSEWEAMADQLPPNDVSRACNSLIIVCFAVSRFHCKRRMF